MKNIALTSATEEVVALKISVVDEYIEEVVDAIGDVGNPEKLIGKRIDLWSPMEWEFMFAIFGKGPESPLWKVYFNREYEHLQELEQGV